MKKITITLLIASVLLLVLFIQVNDGPDIIRNKPPFEQTILGKAEFEMAKIIDPKTKSIPAERMVKAHSYSQKRPKEKTAIARINWEERGPSNVAGRTKTLMIDSRDGSGNTIWTGGVSGGLWKSTNGGASWTIISDLFNKIITQFYSADQHPSTGSNHYITGSQEQ